MCLSAKELEELLMDTGNKLLNPPSSIDALLNALDVRLHFFSLYISSYA